MNVRILLVMMMLGGLPASAGGSIADLGWMEGTWSSEIEGTQMTEVWTSPAGGLMLGLHRDVGDKRVSFEFLRIVERDGELTYVAQPGGGSPTGFIAIENVPGKVVFENPQHDFPQRIIYWQAEASLCARIEGPMNGEEVSMEWCWEKEKE